MKKRTTVTVATFAFLALAVLPLRAAEMKDSPGMKTGTSKTTAQVHKGSGTVKNVDTNAGKISLAHGAIPSLNWPAMTMSFPVKDKALLQGVKPGQDVEFDITQAGQSQFLITRIMPTARK